MWHHCPFSGTVSTNYKSDNNMLHNNLPKPMYPVHVPNESNWNSFIHLFAILYISFLKSNFNKSKGFLFDPFPHQTSWSSSPCIGSSSGSIMKFFLLILHYLARKVTNLNEIFLVIFKPKLLPCFQILFRNVEEMKFLDSDHQTEKEKHSPNPSSPRIPKTNKWYKPRQILARCPRW